MADPESALENKVKSEIGTLVIDWDGSQSFNVVLKLGVDVVKSANETLLDIEDQSDDTIVKSELCNDKADVPADVPLLSDNEADVPADVPLLSDNEADVPATVPLLGDDEADVPGDGYDGASDSCASETGASEIVDSKCATFK